MKTAMQELINDLKNTKIIAEESLNELKNEYIRGIVNQFSKGVLDAIIEGIESEYLEKEKQQILTSNNRGYKVGRKNLSETANDYYSETFNHNV